MKKVRNTLKKIGEKSVGAGRKAMIIGTTAAMLLSGCMQKNQPGSVFYDKDGNEIYMNVEEGNSIDTSVASIKKNFDQIFSSLHGSFTLVTEKTVIINGAQYALTQPYDEEFHDFRYKLVITEGENVYEIKSEKGENLKNRRGYPCYLFISKNNVPIYNSISEKGKNIFLATISKNAKEELQKVSNFVKELNVEEVKNVK